jgi:hypothetical protein
VTLTRVCWFAYDFAFTFYLLKLKCHKFQNVSSLIATQSVYLLSNTDFHFNKKSLKISKGQSESVYRRRTDNAMAKRESTKGQTTSTDNTMAKRYQRSNQNPHIEEEQTTQWPKENVQKDKQRSTKLTYKTKDRVTRTPLKTGDKRMCSGG